MSKGLWAALFHLEPHARRPELRRLWRDVASRRQDARLLLGRVGFLVLREPLYVVRDRTLASLALGAAALAPPPYDRTRVAHVGCPDLLALQQHRYARRARDLSAQAYHCGLNAYGVSRVHGVAGLQGACDLRCDGRLPQLLVCAVERALQQPRRVIPQLVTSGLLEHIGHLEHHEFGDQLAVCAVAVVHSKERHRLVVGERVRDEATVLVDLSVRLAVRPRFHPVVAVRAHDVRRERVGAAAFLSRKLHLGTLVGVAPLRGPDQCRCRAQRLRLRLLGMRASTAAHLL